MHRTRFEPTRSRWILALALVLAAAVLATVSPPARADGAATATTSVVTGTASGTTTTATEVATPSTAGARAAFARTVEARSATANAAEVEKQTSKMVAAAHKVDGDASAGTDATIAGRLATDFHMDASALVSEKQALDISWGNLMIAHTLSASAADATSASVANLVALHKDGMGWGKIAAGLGFKLGPAVSAIEAEGKVAAGQATASGKLAHIASAPGRAGDPDAAGGEGAAAASARAADRAADGAAHAATRAADAAAHADVGLHVGRGGGK